MALGDMNMGGFNSDEAAYNRQNRTQTPDFAPGQGDNSMDDIFYSGNNSQQSTDPFGASPDGGNGMFGNAFTQSNSNGLGGFGGGFGQPPQAQQQQQMSEEDKFFEAVGKGAKGTVSFMKDLSQSFGKVTPLFWAKYGMLCTYTGGAVSVVGLVLRLFGLKIGMQLAIGGILSVGLGSMLWLFCVESGKTCSSEYKDDNTEVEVPPPSISEGDDLFAETDPNFGSFGDDLEDDTEDDDLDDFFSDDDEEDEFSWGDDDITEQPSEGEDLSSALDSMPEIEKGMYTRQYLYEQFVKILPCFKPNFSNMREYDEEDDEFLFWGEKLQEASMATGVAEDYLPELEGLSENLFTIVFKCNRPKGFKPEVIGQELANIYSYEMKKKSVVAFKVNPVGMSCYITLFTGEHEAIALKDMYKKYESFMLEPKNQIPVVVGVDTQGEVMGVDLKIIESMLVTGKPRSGKTWFVQCLLYQICAFNSPEDVNIYILDPKDAVSDYKRLYIPHIKQFEQTDAGVLKMLHRIIDVEAPRRRKLLGDAGCVKIWDYKERYPDVKLPVIYLVIDEMATFASRMDKETKAEYRGMLRILITQLPSLGIRAIMIPHVLKDDLIEKTTSSLVMCRISVKGDAEDIQNVTGSTPKDFRHVLVHQGDMAVRIKEINPDTMFIQAPVLTLSSTKNEELFDYMRRVWGKLLPESIKGSYAENAETDNEQEELLQRFDSEELLEDDDIF